jgi:prophage regulatory protein
MNPRRFPTTTGKTILNPDWQPWQPPVAPERLLRLDSVMALTGLSRPSLWRMEREGRFPKRQKIGARAVAWRESEIRAFLARP